MIGSKTLLDTNIVIELFKGNEFIALSLNNHPLPNIPFAVLGELLLGAYRSSDSKKHLKQVNNFLTKCNVIKADNHTANHYALIKSALLKKGKPIPENDIWIAAVAQQHNLILITRDKHFNEIDHLLLDNW